MTNEPTDNEMHTSVATIEAVIDSELQEARDALDALDAALAMFVAGHSRARDHVSTAHSAIEELSLELSAMRTDLLEF